MGDDEVTEQPAALHPRPAVFLGLHGVMVLTGLGGKPWQWAGAGWSCCSAWPASAGAGRPGWSRSGRGRSPGG